MSTGQSSIAKKAHALAKEIGLNRQDRIDLANMILPGKTVESWVELDDADFGRVLDALEGFLLITHLLREARPQP